MNSPVPSFSKWSTGSCLRSHWNQSWQACCYLLDPRCPDDSAEMARGLSTTAIECIKEKVAAQSSRPGGRCCRIRPVSLAPAGAWEQANKTPAVDNSRSSLPALNTMYSPPLCARHYVRSRLEIRPKLYELPRWSSWSSCPVMIIVHIRCGPCNADSVPVIGGWFQDTLWTEACDRW